MTETLFDASRLSLGESIDLTVASLREYLPRYRHVAVAYSGGKDSTALVSLVAWLMATGRVPSPDRLTVCYADTRMELPPLAAAAKGLLAALRSEGVDVREVVAEMDKRFFVYMLGRGVPPPNNSTFRWCTRQIKVDPMRAELERLSVGAGYGYYAGGVYRSRDRDLYESDPAFVEARRRIRDFKRGKGPLAHTRLLADPETRLAIDRLEGRMRQEMARVVPSPSKVLMLTGVRQGESAARDGRIAVSCGRNGAECGQGWYQEALGDDLCDTLAPILHWRVCLVWEWLADHFGHGYPTRPVADAYGHGLEGDAAEVNARTGCNGCPLATQDTALDNLLRAERWAYLAPLKDLRPLYRWLREPAQRLRMPGRETACAADRPTNRLGPLTLEARRAALGVVLDIQARCDRAKPAGAPPVDTLDAEEVARINELIGAATWPRGWSGAEPRGDDPFERRFPDGSVQREMFMPEATAYRLNAGESPTGTKGGAS